MPQPYREPPKETQLYVRSTHGLRDRIEAIGAKCELSTSETSRRLLEGAVNRIEAIRENDSDKQRTALKIEDIIINMMELRDIEEETADDTATVEYLAAREGEPDEQEAKEIYEEV